MITKEQVLNICKRIDDGKATEEEVCALCDLALTALAAPDAGVVVPKLLLGELLTDLFNVTHSIEYVGDYYATKNGPLYHDMKAAQEKIRAMIAARPKASQERDAGEIADLYIQPSENSGRQDDYTLGWNGAITEVMSRLRRERSDNPAPPAAAGGEG